MAGHVAAKIYVERLSYAKLAELSPVRRDGGLRMRCGSGKMKWDMGVLRQSDTGGIPRMTASAGNDMPLRKKMGPDSRSVRKDHRMRGSTQRRYQQNNQ